MTTDGMDPFNPLRGKQFADKSKQKNNLPQSTHRVGQISILRQPTVTRRPINADAEPARVISMIDRLDQQGKRQKPQKPAPPRMSVGGNAYDRFRVQQKQMRSLKIRRDILTFLICVLLLCSTGFFTYQVTSAWFTGRSITLATLVDTSHFSRSTHHKKAKNSKKTKETLKAHDTELNGKKATTSRGM